jgi:hypothetical protein
MILGMECRTHLFCFKLSELIVMVVIGVITLSLHMYVVASVDWAQIYYTQRGTKW